jgi:branched-chain amino acid aminotransferase
MALEVTYELKTESNIASVDFDHIQFGRVFADHMFLAEYDGQHWGNCRIVPYGPLSLSPATSALHYGQAIFEGMKAFKDTAGHPLLFRPFDNAARFNRSARRMCMPEIPESLFVDALERLIWVDREWIPTKDGSSLYIRPFMFATDEFLGVRPSTRYMFNAWCCPVVAYYSQPLKVKIEEQYSRAAPGGVGFTKCAGNYGAAMLPTKEAQEAGYDQVLWTDPVSHEYLEETGTTNCFVVAEGRLLTPSLTDTMLEGITRSSVIEFARSRGISVEERPISVNDLKSWHASGVLQEMFITGTAATLVSIKGFGHEGKYFDLEPQGNNSISASVLAGLDAIRTGREEDKFGWVHPIPAR